MSAESGVSSRLCLFCKICKMPHLQDVYDAKVEDHILWLCAGVLGLGKGCGYHMHAQLHPLLPHAVADLVRRPRAERHRPALAICTFANSLPGLGHLAEGWLHSSLSAHRGMA